MFGGREGRGGRHEHSAEAATDTLYKTTFRSARSFFLSSRSLLFLADPGGFFLFVCFFAGKSLRMKMRKWNYDTSRLELFSFPLTCFPEIASRRGVFIEY